MSEDKRTADPEAEDLARAPFIDEAERAEAAWLLARDNDPSAPAPSPEIARDHAELGDLLGNLPTGSPDESWHDEVLRQAASSRVPSRPRQRRPVARWAIAGGLIAAAAVAALVLIPGSRPRTSELEIAIRHEDPARGDAREAVVGDRLIVKARPRGTGDLRVYRADGALVARCPAGPGCITSAHGEHAIEIRLDAPVQYYVILVIGITGDMLGKPMDAYLEAARAANARIVTYPPIDVH